MALDTMGLMGGTDVLREISMRLEESHLAYLQLDESLLKLQARQKLEGFIKEYLCHVPNERKYVFQETADILHRSAATVKDFSGYRACTAWRALSLYASNLLAQPWRKEYRTLRTYSGYYKHEIEANLIGAELMFELMGYKHTGLGVLTLEDPIDPDRVSNVSRDAIVAFVECQILKEIWESVSQKFTVSWLEVLEFRCNSVGTSEQAIRALNFRFLERSHQSREKNPFRDFIHVPPMPMEAPMAAIVPQTIPYHAIPNNYNTTIMSNPCKPDSVYPTDANFYFPPMAATNLTNRCVNAYPCRPTINHYDPLPQTHWINPMTTSALPSYVTTVPTGRLIELDPPLPVANYERSRPVLDEISNKTSKMRCQDTESDEIDHRRSARVGNVDDRQDYARVLKRTISKSSRSNVDTRSANDWEFVYKDLESRGYSKDLGERDDVLRKKELLLEAKNSARSQLKNSRSLVNVDQDDKYDKYGVNRSRDEKKRIATGATSRGINSRDCNLEFANGQENQVRDCLEFRKKGSLDLHDTGVGTADTMSENNYSILENSGKRESNTLPSSRNIYKSSSETSGTTKKIDSTRESKRGNLGANSWNCAACTYLNPCDREICEMCDKSRRKGNEDKPLASGGKECPQCTLVNEKNAATCEACYTDLQGSPTYI